MLLDEAQLKPLGENEYFSDDLIGCEVFDLSGRPLGRVTGVIETGANDVLEVESGAGKTLVPVTGEVVKTIAFRERRIEIDPLPGSFGREH
jgi:16S rRNA processing protein RimM